MQKECKESIYLSLKKTGKNKKKAGQEPGHSDAQQISLNELIQQYINHHIGMGY